jgi:hypothetical protein
MRNIRVDWGCLSRSYEEGDSQFQLDLLPSILFYPGLLSVPCNPSRPVQNEPNGH